MSRAVRPIVLLLLSMTVSLPLMAQVYRSPETDAQRPTVAPVNAPAEGMLVAIDPVTGELRQPTAAEAAALTMAQREKVAPTRVLRIVQTASGMAMIELDDSFLEYFTVRIGEDGKLHGACAQPDQVDTVLRLPVRTAPKLEEK
jgi:hypothetical protein